MIIGLALAKPGMGARPLVWFLMLHCVLVFPVKAFTEAADVTALQALLENWKSVLSTNWSGSDPCGSYWRGVYCSNGTVTRLDLGARGLAGPVPAAIGGLANLTILFLHQNNLNGTIPSEIGNLTSLSTLSINRLSNLQQLSLNQNLLVGPLPELSNLTSLTRLYLQNNHITGSIPSSIGSIKYLQTLYLSDNLFSGPLPPSINNLSLLTTLYVDHNVLSGAIPDLSALKSLQYLWLQDNQFTGAIPSELGNLPSLQNLGMENNHFTGSLPDTINQLSSIPYLFLQNNRLSGPLPDLSGLINLQGLDLTNNSFVLGSVPTWLSKMQNLITLNLVNCGLTGDFPSWLTHSFPAMTTATFNLNQFNGTLDISNVNRNLTLLSLEDNKISGLHGTVPGFISVKLGGNPICKSVTFSQPDLCDLSSGYGPRTWRQDLSCSKLICQQGQSLSPENCTCMYPLVFNIILISTSFSTFNAPRIGGLESQLAGQLKITSDRVWVQSANFTSLNQTVADILVFPAQSGFWDDSEVSFIESQLRSGKSLTGYGQYRLQFLAPPQGNIRKTLSKVLPIVLGVTLSLVAILIASSIALLFWRRYRNKEFLLRYGVQQEFAKHSLQPMFFTYHDAKMITNDFSQSNKLGEGGFGEVFKGLLPDGTKVALKRLYASRSLQGTHEFINEVTIITGVLHRNLVKLIGCCIEETERILIYEFVEHNSLYHVLFGSSNGPILDWPCRYNIAIGTARGLAYLHDDCETRIIHRDIKASNILLDKNFQPKIADFGLARLFPDGASHVSTRVAGTFGYVAPEYGLYGQLTEKADVFSFGVVMLELVSGKKSVTFGADYVLLLEWAWQLYEENRLMELVDSTLKPTLKEEEAKRVIDVALLCTQAMATKRPTMPQVVAMLVGEREIRDVPNAPGVMSELMMGKSRSSSSVEAKPEASY
ncbi:hypothetical protein O6H91_09G090300 [Diphasiastrum complanatum]|uniref:Uncharacterized protein n=1 Tax=Diphasiastrum complanatum TaxID=34168 RepID=A0ACC2CRP9_DIPCM|nr:hypothetical protein O6H91_09G090300 [Diphasiastrum complanatum]